MNLDIESSPAKVFIWDLKVGGGYITPEKIIEPKRMICFAAKWVGEPKVYFYSNWHDGRVKMVQRMWDLLNEADAVLHYNGTRFDMPNINTEFVMAGLNPPSPYKQIDLYKAVKRNFNFMSSSLDQVSKTLGTARKLQHEGFDLWRKVMAGDGAAQKKMRLYNIGDVHANEELYARVAPWIPGIPNAGLYGGGEGCLGCGSRNVRADGFTYTGVSKFRRFHCLSCGRWQRDSRSLGSAKYREVIL